MKEPTSTDLARWEKWADLRARQEAATTDAEKITLALEEEALWEEGFNELTNQDLSNDPVWYWLSFADASLPVGKQFLGVAIVRAGGVVEAAQIAHMMGCNPGGEVKAIEIPPEHVPHRDLCYRLLSEQDLKDAGLI